MKFPAFALAVSCLINLAAAHAECTDDSKKSMLSRVVAIGSTNGAIDGKLNPGELGRVPYPLELKDKELVLTFDQGPHGKYTDYILGTLDRFCAKAVFFFTERAALENPDTVREVAARGHTVAVAPRFSADFIGISLEAAKAKIERGFATVGRPTGGQIAPFFRAPSDGLPPSVMAYLKERGVSLWSYDIAAEDTEPGVRLGKFESRTIASIHKAGKGVIQFHDWSKITVDALDDILSDAKRSGFRIVQPVAGTAFVPKREYLNGIARATPKTQVVPRGSRSLNDAPRQKVRVHSKDEPEAHSPSWHAWQPSKI
jgi:peptidoglycan/xylan/chitin deacetylase (PgdA/CDA1 family)